MGEPFVGYCVHRNLLFIMVALPWVLALASFSPAQETTTSAENPPNASAALNVAPENCSDGQSNEKSKDEAAPPAYKLLRYDEDYSYLKDPSRRTDFWDPIKYIPLCCREDWYLSFGGEVRERYEFYHNADAGLPP